MGAPWLQWGNLRERGRGGGVLPHLGACRVEQPCISGWGVSDPLFSLSAATMSCWAPGQRWVPCTARAWLWCHWPDGGPGVQTRKPLHASRSEDMRSVNIYYLPKGNKARLGPPPPQGAQMGAVGATLPAASCSLRGGFRPGHLLWTHSLSVKWESQWAVPHWTVVTLTWVNPCRVSKMAPCTRVLAAEILDACALRAHGRWYLGGIPNRVPPPHPSSQRGFFYPKAGVWSSILRSESAAKDRLSPSSSFQGPRVPFPVQPQSLVVSQGSNTWRPLSRGETPEGACGLSLPASGGYRECSAVPFF